MLFHVQVAELWGVSAGRVREIFRARPGVIQSEARRSRMLIPQSLLDQVAAERAAWQRGERRASPSCPIRFSRVSDGGRTTTVAAGNLFEAAIKGLRWFEIDSREPGEIVRLPDDAVLTVEMASGSRSSVRVGRVRAWVRFLSGRVAAAD